MNEIKEIVELFQKADEMIVDYLGMMEDMQHHIRAHLERNVPLPTGACVALNAPYDKVFLARALQDLNDDKKVVATHLNAIRTGIADAKKIMDIGLITILVLDWSTNAERSMETVINSGYKQSDILPPPIYYWIPISHKWHEIFRYDVDDPRSDQQLNAVLHYLRTVNNPWTKYQK